MCCATIDSKGATDEKKRLEKKNANFLFVFDLKLICECLTSRDKNSKAFYHF